MRSVLLLEHRQYYGILLGFALDLTTNDNDGRCWDFDEEEMRRRAWAKIEEEQPMLRIG